MKSPDDERAFMRVERPCRSGGAVVVAAVIAGITALAPAAMAQPRDTPRAVAVIETTIDANSQLRWGPHLSDAKAGVTRSRAYFVIECYARGSWYDDGKHHTDVWYNGAVTDGDHIYPNIYSWGGNVNTRKDPPDGLRFCG
ncbi:hypothetical protein ACH427_32010 [Streptomyces sp. NPDC020379]|uniref:hypothetical protein n=1 Tax=Streptomyces sp. NPDC020379 TaxID=3365071 RepID=UPI0037AA6811